MTSPYLLAVNGPDGPGKKLHDDGIYAKYGEGTARKVLDALIDKYADEGIAAIENTMYSRSSP